jgi:uncharacterized protein (TIGR02145 family)
MHIKFQLILLAFFVFLISLNLSAQEFWITVGGHQSDCPATLDYAGQTYDVVLIGNHCIMAENLNIGVRIDGGVWPGDVAIEKYCYDNLESNCDTYGGLYTWHEAMDWVETEGAQGICPDGWHIPTDAEWQDLINFLGGQYGTGGKLKATGTTYWTPTNDGATNISGFTGLPGGRCNYWDGGFENRGDFAYFWSSTEYDFIDAWILFLHYNTDDVYKTWKDPNHGYSVRCLKN